MNHNKENGKINNGGKSGKYSLSDPSLLLLQTSSTVVHATGGEDSTPRRTHRTLGTDAYFSRAHVIDAHALAQDLTVKDTWIVCLRALIKSHSVVSCFVVHCLSHSSLRPLRSHHSAQHHFRHRPLCGILQRVENPALLRKEVSSLADWPSRALSQILSPTLSSRSAASTRRSTFLREKTASTISRPRRLHLKLLARKKWDS